MNDKTQERNEYIAKNNLQDSFIDPKVLYTMRGVIPKRKEVGITSRRGHKIFFEETRGSLTHRKYGNKEIVTSWNLVYFNGKKTKKVTLEYLKVNAIHYNEGFNLDILRNFLKNNTNRFNALTGVKKVNNKGFHTLWCTVDEFDMVKDFLKKIRRKNNENSQV